MREAAPADHADAEPGSDDQHTEDNDDGEAVPDDFVPTAVHATTTAVDDWLHRGPFLEPLPLFVYMQHVQRVPKSQRVRTGGGMHFAFDAHYAMSALYNQTVSPFSMIPRLVGPAAHSTTATKGRTTLADTRPSSL